ncbi:MAG: right-handed parallel beta-helix repeat-containing protein, partial [Planctomycetes bacterium]|nr:right-handed parallel beta-helix repeat-containing protein [Planctomycetota bacterium]
STLSGNSANAGGGLAGDGGAVIEIVNTTFSNNTAAAGGGGIWNNGAAASIHHSTLTLNTASSGGGVDNSGSGTVQVKSTIVAANTATSASDVSGAFASAGNNLIGDGTGGAGFTHGVDGNQVGTGASPIDPLLGPLQHNGGPTFTHALLPGSPALDAGSDTDAPPSDQRGALRAVDGPDPDAIATCDVGAYEYVAIGFIVNTTDDTVDADPGDGVAEDASGNTSLRAAIMESNALAGDDTITLGVGPYTLTRDGQNEDEAAVGDLDVTDNLTILGVGGVVHANQIDRAFDVRPGASLDLSGTTVTGGFVSNEDGGGIRNKQGLLTLTNCVLEGNETIRVTFYGGRGAGLFNSSGDVTVRHSTIQNNVAELSGGGIGHEDFGTILVINSLLTANSSSNGGAISNMGQGPNSLLKVVESVISNNSATGNAGGGIANYNGDVELIDSTLSGNTTSLSGGGISCYNNSGGRPVGTVTIIGCTISGNSGSNAGGIDNDGPMTIINSTISGNTSRSYYGGGINQRESLTMAGCTIVANSAGARGGGIAIFGSDTTTTTIRNTIIAGNSAAQSEPDVYDIYSYGDSLGNNLIGDGQGAPSFVNGVNGDQVGSGASPIDPMLGPLMDNGGPTWTHALVPGSPAIDAGGNSGAPSTDQRGFARIADGDEDGTATIDIGAFEFGAIEVGDLALYSVTADGLTTLTLVYQIAVAPADPFQIGFYRSDDSLFQPADELLDSVLISDPADLTAGMHLKTFPIGGGSGEIALPGAGTDETGTDYHLLAVADPDNTIVELDLDPFNEDNTVAFTGVYHVAGGDVFVHGTSDPDTVIVSPGSLRLEVNASVTVYEGADVTGVRVRTHEGADSFDFTYGAGFGSPAAVSLFFQGGAGENNAVLRGSSDAETVTIHPGTAVFQGPGFDVNVTNASGITVHGGGDLDLALIHDDPLAKDTLIGGPDTATLSGNGYSNEVAGFRYVHVYGTTGNGDEALFQGDPNGQDTFEAWPGQAKLRGDDFFLRAKSFGDVRANGTPGGNDIALLHDDPEGIDTFDGGPDRAELSGDGFFLQANWFRYVHAYATDGGGDAATFHDDPARFD